FCLSSFTQTASLSGVVTDSLTSESLIGVNIIFTGTNFGSATDLNGQYAVTDIPAGEYNIQASYIGYEKLIFTGVKFSSGENKKLNIRLHSTTLVFDDAVVIVGDKPLVDVEDAGSSSS